ncbi:MAG: DUF4893 domain-containing protein [Pseudomonadota bacterium]|nr:DUF4893 domain-containing protein [Pseudomonadota bacterium]
MKLILLSVCAAALGLAACTSGGAEMSAAMREVPEEYADWRTIATQSDRVRLRQWRTAWVEGLEKANAGGHSAALVKEGVLLQPDAAIAWESPPAGDYRCRTLKVGAKAEGMLDYVAYPPFDCRLRAENGLISFAKLTGSQRPLGLMLPDTSRRMIFLGTLQLGDERMAMQYGRDRERDMVAVVERVGAQRWRMVFPYPHFESTVDVLELVPRG